MLLTSQGVRVSGVAQKRFCVNPCLHAVKRCCTHAGAGAARLQPRRRLVPTCAAPAAAAEAPAKAKENWQIALAELEVQGPGKKLSVVQIAPAVRVAIAETVGLPPGSVSVGQLVTGLRTLGFDFVFDTLFGADLTIMEEGHELLQRLHDHLEQHPNKDEPLPMFTSCCPGWVAMVEKSYPDLIPYLSSCKSPQMMLGAVIKNYFAQQQGVAPQDIVGVSVMPCTRKQGEADRPWFDSTGHRDVDHVITTDQLGKIFLQRGIALDKLEESAFDNPLSEGSGAAQLFGTTGGVMEAALRTVYEVVSGQPMERLVFDDVRGLDGVKETTLTIKPSPESPFTKFAGPDGEGISLRICVAHGLGNAKKLVTNLQNGTAKYDFVEVMACPGGCIGGGGQPRSKDKEIIKKRQAAMYEIDERMTLRRSHDNTFIKMLYENFLDEPLSHKAHHLLHTHYVPGGPESA